MKDLKALSQRAMKELDVIGVPFGYVEDFTINTRATSRWGQCKRRDDVFSININIELLQDNVSDESLLNTLIHELIHTCPNCMNHGKEWLKWAELVNDCYSCYNIKRCSSAEEKGLNIEEHIKREESTYKWKLKCFSCNREWKYKRKPTIFYINKDNILPFATCSCGCTGKVKLIKL